MSPGPEDPIEYIKCVVSKVSQIQKWTSRVDQGLQRDTFDLSDLLNPDTFLSAVAQQTAREYSISMNDLKLVSSWSRGGISGAKVSIKV